MSEARSLIKPYMNEIIVRPLKTMAEMVEVENIQRTSWNMAELQIIPAHTLHALQHNGAAVLGAMDGEQVVGFALGVIATVEDYTIALTMWRPRG